MNISFRNALVLAMNVAVIAIVGFLIIDAWSVHRYIAVAIYLLGGALFFATVYGDSSVRSRTTDVVLSSILTGLILFVAGGVVLGGYKLRADVNEPFFMGAILGIATRVLFDNLKCAIIFKSADYALIVKENKNA